MERVGVPRRLAARLLYRSDHTCCICRELHKDVEIHHIDENNRNNDWTNLAVLCRDCHSKVTGTRGLGRGYFPEEVKEYKEEWERAVKKRRSLIAGTRSSLPKIGGDLTLFEIKRATYELAATNRLVRVKQILEYLEMFYVFEGTPEPLLEQMQLVAPYLSGSRKASAVVEYVLHYFWHLIGPEDVRATKSDIRSLLKAADLFVTMAQMEETYGGIGNMKQMADAIYRLYEVAEDYKLPKIKRVIRTRMRSVRREVVNIVGDRAAHPLTKRVDSYLAKMGAP